jgi:hypothetical protein
MKLQEIAKISKLYFGYREISRVLGITEPSARVLASRYAERGFLIRVKRNIYVLRERWTALSREESFEIANILEVPSYISLMTALEYYGVTTQIQRSAVESLSIRRTGTYETAGKAFFYTRISRELYGGFSREKGFFMASPEKAFLDALYLKSISRYRFDVSSLNVSKLDRKQTEKLAKKYPQATVKAMVEIWKR